MSKRLQQHKTDTTSSPSWSLQCQHCSKGEQWWMACVASAARGELIRRSNVQQLTADDPLTIQKSWGRQLQKYHLPSLDVNPPLRCRNPAWRTEVHFICHFIGGFKCSTNASDCMRPPDIPPPLWEGRHSWQGGYLTFWGCSSGRRATLLTFHGLGRSLSPYFPPPPSIHIDLPHTQPVYSVYLVFGGKIWF